MKDIVKDYNNTIHCTIDLRPNEVDKFREKELLNTVYEYIPPKTVTKSKFKIGDRVRMTKKKDTFSNKYTKNWTREIFIITKINNTDPVTYNIEDLGNEEITGSFYDSELLKTKL